MIQRILIGYAALAGTVMGALVLSYASPMQLLFVGEAAVGVPMLGALLLSTGLLDRWVRIEEVTK